MAQGTVVFITERVLQPIGLLLQLLRLEHQLVYALLILRHLLIFVCGCLLLYLLDQFRLISFAVEPFEVARVSALLLYLLIHVKAGVKGFHMW